MIIIWLYDYYLIESKRAVDLYIISQNDFFFCLMYYSVLLSCLKRKTFILLHTYIHQIDQWNAGLNFYRYFTA